MDPSLSTLLPSFCAVFLKRVGILTHLLLSAVSTEAAVTFSNLPFFYGGMEFHPMPADTYSSHILIEKQQKKNISCLQIV